MERVRVLRIFNLDDPDPCAEVLAKAAKFYDTDLKLKEVPLEEGETPGERAANVPKLGDIAACKKRGK